MDKDRVQADHSSDTEIPTFVSHVSDDGRYESVACHLHEVAEMAREFAEPLGLGDMAYWAGLYHDIGKYSSEFQRRILRGGPKVDHSTAGAFEAGKVNAAIAYCIAGHHGGLPDGGTKSDNADETTLHARFSRARDGRIPDYGDFRVDELPPLPSSLVSYAKTPVRDTRDDYEYTLTFLIRMLYSCLVDADFLCTERFMRGRARESSTHDGIPELSELLEKKVRDFYPPEKPLNVLRCQVLDDCARAAAQNRGFFSLTVPTGGGKTLASMRFALRHALAHGMDRVVYGIPYTSIIEQNAKVFREVFGDRNVLEHHGAMEVEADGDPSEDSSDIRYRLRQATENWDAPLIVTTNVQLFESLYASKPSRCRKLHNLANTVIVLDEAQMLPTEQLLPCLRALIELVHNYGCTVVFCTATQPALKDRIEDYGFEVTEIAPQAEMLFEQLRRVTYADLGEVSDEVLANQLAELGQVLCIVNSRAQAQRLYDLVVERVGSEGTFHLSTLMYPAHRTRVIDEIRARLKDRKACRVVSTSLVEAGVDLDFPTVFRAKAGLDSLIQAAGRCNRENKRLARDSRVFLFDSENPYRIPADTEQKRAIALGHMSDIARIDDPDNVTAYFGELYSYRNLDKRNVLLDLSDSRNGCAGIPFRSASERFKMIEDGSYPVIIPDEEMNDLISGIRDGNAKRAVFRRLATHAVNVYEDHLKQLLASGVVESLVEGEHMFVLIDEGSYDERTGLASGTQEGRGVFC